MTDPLRWSLREVDGGPLYDGMEADVGGMWVLFDDVVKRIAELEEALERANDRIRAWTESREPPALEDNDALGPPDIRELIEAAPRFRGDREGGKVKIDLEVYEAVVSRSEIVAYGSALAWQQKCIAELLNEAEDKKDEQDSKPS